MPRGFSESPEVRLCSLDLFVATTVESNQSNSNGRFSVVTLRLVFGCSHFRRDPPHAVREIQTESCLNLRGICSRVIARQHDLLCQFRPVAGQFVETPLKDQLGLVYSWKNGLVAVRARTTWRA
jgi:hypothetical protein